MFLLFLAGQVISQTPSNPEDPELKERSEKMLKSVRHQLLFEENKGQFDAQYKFKAVDRQASYYFLDGEVQTVVEKADGRSVLRMPWNLSVRTKLL